MAGRGMRIKSHADHCLVLDFAGVVATHGPITAVQPPKKAGDGNGEAPVKVCDNCGELCHPSVAACPACGKPFPAPEGKRLELRDDDIMGLVGKEMMVTGWDWRKHTSRASGKEMLSCTYYGGLMDKPITEYLPILHDGYAGDKARRQLAVIAQAAGADTMSINKDIDDGQEAGLPYVANTMSESLPPRNIEYRIDGKFHRIINRSWA